MQSANFEGKLLEKLDRLDPHQLLQVFSQIVDQKQFLLSILDALNEGVIVTDGALRLQFANPKARLMLGLPRRRNILGEDLGRLLAESNPLAEIIGSLRDNLREIKGYEAPYGRRRDRFVELTTLPVRTPAGQGLRGPVDPAPRVPAEAPMLILLLQDVTERRLRQAEQARAQRLASMATLTSGIAHEIKNPLNSMNIHAQLLQEELNRASGERRPLNVDRAQRAGRVITEEIGRLGRIVDDFIQAARPRQPELASTAVAGFLEQVVRIFRPEFEQAGIEFSLKIDPDLPPVMLDEHLMLQALRNLIHNAIDALKEARDDPRGQPPDFRPMLELTADASGDTVTLAVGDNGPGIEPDVLEHIFEPYYTTKFHGTGLGLMVVYRIVTEHKGSLHVDTRPGEGTRFMIALPLHQKPVRLLENTPEVRSGPAGTLLEP